MTSCRARMDCSTSANRRLTATLRASPVRDGDGEVLARWDVRHAHGIWIDSQGDIYLGLTTSQSVDKYVRVR